MTKFLNISTDNTLGGNSPSNEVVSSQKALKNYIDAHSGGGGSVTVDGKSITRNSSLEIQTVGVIDSNNTSNAVKIWTGTRARYNAIATKNPNTLYNITDDTDVTLTILEALYPVGSIYITTDDTCPLSTLISGSTWELVSSGRVLQGADSGHSAGTTIEAGLPDFDAVFVNHARDYSPAKDKSLTPVSGAIAVKSDEYPKSSYPNVGGSSTGSYNYDQTVEIRPSISNSIYGNSSTVQPPAYVVNIYRRVA